MIHYKAVMNARFALVLLIAVSTLTASSGFSIYREEMIRLLTVKLKGRDQQVKYYVAENKRLQEELENIKRQCPTAQLDHFKA